MRPRGPRRTTARTSVDALVLGTVNAPLRRAVTIEEIASALASGAAPPDGRMSLALRAFFEECAPETQIVFLRERAFAVDDAIRLARALGVASDAWVLNL